jgi:hypothetical protein
MIAAGGRGNRLYLGRPKSSLLFLNRSLLWWTVNSIRTAGYLHIDIFVNDAEWREEFKIQVADFDGVNVRQDVGYENTFLMFRANIKEGYDYLFTYGHAPRQPSDYRRLADYPTPVVASSVTTTSKRHLVTGFGRLLEPPYLIRRPLIKRIQAENWQKFFESNIDALSIAPDLEISEFNSPDEWKLYQSYLEHRLKPSLNTYRTR